MNSDPYTDLNMSEVFDDWEQYEETLMEDIYRDPECRRELYDAERVVSAWDNDPDYEGLDETDDYTEDDWEDSQSTDADWEDLEDDVDEGNPMDWR